MPTQPRPFRRSWWIGLLLVLPVLALAVLAVLGGGLTYQEGEWEVPYRFRTTDADTDLPLPGSFIRLFSQGRVARDLLTGPDGEADTTVPCVVAVRRGLFARHETVVVPDWCFFVSALGHKISGPFYLRDYAEPRDEAPAPPVIVIRLQKQDAIPVDRRPS
jgi:hypothetical protein